MRKRPKPSVQTETERNAAAGPARLRTEQGGPSSLRRNRGCSEKFGGPNPAAAAVSAAPRTGTDWTGHLSSVSTEAANHVQEANKLHLTAPFLFNAAVMNVFFL